MFDIEFLRRVADLKDQIVGRELGPLDAERVGAEFERMRSPSPTVFNVETTNYCNMTCVMCPRTTLMTRKSIWIHDHVFERVLDQIQPHDPAALAEFWEFAARRYDVSFDRPDENAFYFHVVSRCLILHGYGEPIIDPKIVERVRACTQRGIPTYFSCVPANLTVEKASALMDAGLTVLKLSIDALTDEQQKQIRGKMNNFTAAHETLRQVVARKAEKGAKTLIVPTMIALSETPDAKEMQRAFLDLFRGLDVFAYVKSQDNRWYHEEDAQMANRSHYEQQYCEYPWTSLTVMADGSVVPCTQDYDTELVLGNVNDQTLAEIWNGERYRALRRFHVTGEFPAGHKCRERCDQKKVCDYLAPQPVRRDEDAIAAGRRSLPVI